MIDRTKSLDIGTSAFRDKDEPMYNCHYRLVTRPKPAFQFASMSQHPNPAVFDESRV
jgi:hypothetical protein